MAAAVLEAVHNVSDEVDILVEEGVLAGDHNASAVEVVLEVVHSASAVDILAPMAAAQNACDVVDSPRTKTEVVGDAGACGVLSSQEVQEVQEVQDVQDVQAAPDGGEDAWSKVSWTRRKIYDSASIKPIGRD
jgi:hypothetical protein